MWAGSGHPVLIPGSNKDWSYVLRPEGAAVKSGLLVTMERAVEVSLRGWKTLNQRAIDDEYAAAGSW